MIVPTGAACVEGPEPAREKGAAARAGGLSGMAMPENLPATGDAARPRFRGVITTVLLILISVLIVRDILVRRWTTPPASDMTERSR